MDDVLTLFEDAMGQHLVEAERLLFPEGNTDPNWTGVPEEPTLDPRVDYSTRYERFI